MSRSRQPSRPKRRGFAIRAAGAGSGWKYSFGTNIGEDTITAGLEVAWTYHPDRWENEYLPLPFAYEWELMESPPGAKQWRPKNGADSDLVPLAHDTSEHRACSRQTLHYGSTRPEMRVVAVLPSLKTHLGMPSPGRDSH